MVELVLVAMENMLLRRLLLLVIVAAMRSVFLGAFLFLSGATLNYQGPRPMLNHGTPCCTGRLAFPATWPFLCLHEFPLLPHLRSDCILFCGNHLWSCFGGSAFPEVKSLNKSKSHHPLPESQLQSPGGLVWATYDWQAGSFKLRFVTSLSALTVGAFCEDPCGTYVPNAESPSLETRSLE